MFAPRSPALARALALAQIGTCFAAAPVRAYAQAVADVRYDVVCDRETAREREIHVEMSFAVTSDAPVALSLPAWTPGSYSLDNYARNVRDMRAWQDGSQIRWDKADHDTWRVYPRGAGRVTIAFDYMADALDTAGSWTQADFAFFNGTNLFFFPEGSDLAFRSTVAIDTEPDWRVVTGLAPGRAPREFVAADYHELVDMPTFVGRFDVDSMEVGGTWYRLATYPVGTLAGEPRALLWDRIRRIVPTMTAVFGDEPWERYTTLLVFDAGFGGGSALEHSDSHLGIYHPEFLGSTVLASITAHEIFHAWNVKRLRPADLWPYDYGRAMPTELLWISEGITDYYADLALVRGGVVTPQEFYSETSAKIQEVTSAVPVALEDASLSAWIEPRDGTASLYYPKGSLAGLMLDILIRDASDNARSLDDVLASLYGDTYKLGQGFTEAQWWNAVSAAAGGRSFLEFHDAYVDGREPCPWNEILPLAGLRLRTATERVARIGVTTSGSSQGTRVADVLPGSSAAAAGVRPGDVLLSVAGIAVEDQGFGAEFRARFGGEPEGTPYDIVVERGGERLALRAELRFAELTSAEIEEDPAAGEKARRIRSGILAGQRGR
jgi:predicted metalloprotease with PDZ domain